MLATVAALLALCADSPAATPNESCTGDADITEALTGMACVVRGVQFEDSNGNDRRDAGEPGLGGWIVFADFDGDGQRGPGEPFAVSAADGSYELTVPFEQATAPFALDQETPPGWLCTVPTAVCSYAEQPFIDSDPEQQPDLERDGRDFGAVALVKASGPPVGTKAAHGFARLSVGAACPSRYARMSVRGRGVANVSYFLDGQKLMTVIKPDSRGRFAYRIRSARMTPGVHRIRAQVTFTAASATASTTLKSAVQRCRPARPRFAG